jgi:endonuclease I
MKRNFALFVSLYCLAAHSQSTLVPGDLTVLAHNFDNPDQVVLLATVPVAQGTVVRITDNGWTGSALTTSEGTWTFTLQAALNAGQTVVLSASSPGITSAGTFELNTSGDQIFLYQGTASAPSFLYGFSTRSWVTGSISQTTSRLPSTLSNGSTARDFSTEVDNGFFSVTTLSNTRAVVLSTIGSTSNWSRSNSRYTSFPAWNKQIGSASSTEPLAQPTNLTFSSIRSFQFQVNWTAPNPVAGGVIVLRTVGSQPSAVPLDGVSYAIGDAIGNAKVVYQGTAVSFAQRDVVAGTTYGYALYSYTGTGGARNYRQLIPLTGSVTSGDAQPGSYFANISPTESNFVSALQSRIRSPYTTVSYDQYDETMVTNFTQRDTTGGQKTTTCVYSGQNILFTPPFAWIPNTPFSREHTWCHSWMPTSKSSSTQEYADQHHLFPVNQNSANAVRSNRPLGNVVSVISSFLNGTYGFDSNGFLVYEPRDEQKGDAARSLLYMALRYNGVNGQNWTFGQLNNVTLPALNEDPQLLSLLLQWHAQDPPSAFEKARNEFIQSLQQNRNPFIDFPEWVYSINFETLQWVSTPLAMQLAEQSDNETLLKRKPVSASGIQVKAYPNPVADFLNIAAFAGQDSELEITIIDLQGREVFSEKSHLFAGANEWKLPCEGVENGMYLVVMRIGNDVITHRTIFSR